MNSTMKTVEQKEALRVIVSGGGTGGHIYPAIAIANTIKERHPGAEIRFVGAKGRMEMEKVPQAGYAIDGLWISGIQRKLTIDNLSFPLKLISSIKRSREILRGFKPHAAIGTGGYASGPLLYAASQKGIPTLISEQNSFAGLTNKWLAGKVDSICVAHEGMEQYFPAGKIVNTGNPVRKDILDVDAKREAALAHFGLNADKPVLLILGGSLGARTLNQVLRNHLGLLIEAGVQVLWQTGKMYYEDSKAAVEGLDLTHVRLLEFIREMDLAYAAATAVVSRAGALSISELSLVKRPTIFVPSPNVAEDHQTKNADALVAHKAALMVKDADAAEQLVPAALALLRSPAQQEELKHNIAALGKPNAAEDIVDQLDKLLA